MKKKIVSICLVVALIAIAVVGASLAYFTDSEKVENTFTMGKGVDIDLDEDVDVPDDKKDDPTWQPGTKTDDGADYEDVVPGVNYAKKAVISVEEDSQDAYVFAELSVKDYNKLYAALTAAGFDATDLSKLLVNADLGTGVVIDAWMDGPEGAEDTFHIVFTKGVMEAEDTWTLFDAVKIPGEFTSDIVKDLGEISFQIKGYAIQATGFADAASAWAELDPVA